jgi:hypothetical protein
MSVVWKFPLKKELGPQRVQMPCRDTKPLSVGVQKTAESSSALCVWAAIDPDAPLAWRTLFLAFTGGAAPAEPGTFLGTVDANGYIFHCWDLGWG